MVYPSNITLNLNTRYVLPIPTAQQGDTARVLTFNILDNGVPFSLVGKSVRAKIIKPDGTKVFNGLTITNATNGECNLALTNQVLAVVGIVECQLEITEGQDILSTIIFNIEVRESIDVTGAVESSNEFTALQNGLTKLDEWDKYFHETSGAIEEKYTTRLNAVESSLEEIIPKININPLDFNAKGDGVTDDTQAFNDLVDYIGTLVNGLSLPWSAKNVGGIEVNLLGKNYLINNKINLTKISGLSFFNFVGGTISVGEHFPQEDYMISIGGETGTGHTYCVNFKNVFFEGKNKASGAFLKNTLNVQFDECYFFNMVNGVVHQNTNTHETIISKCYFNKGSGTAISVGVDGHVLSNIIVGFAVGILVNGGGATLIELNHIYSTPIGIKTVTPCQGAMMCMNYLDGSVIELGLNGKGCCVANNLFLSQLKYYGIKVNKDGSTGYSVGFTSYGNRYLIYDDVTPSLNGINVTIDGDNMTSTTFTFATKHEGATNSDGSIQILQYISPTQVKIINKNNLSGVQSLWLKPTNILLNGIANENALEVYNEGVVGGYSLIYGDNKDKQIQLTIPSEYTDFIGDSTKAVKKNGVCYLDINLKSSTNINNTGSSGKITPITLPDGIRPKFAKTCTVIFTKSFNVIATGYAIVNKTGVIEIMYPATQSVFDSFSLDCSFVTA